MPKKQKKSVEKYVTQKQLEKSLSGVEQAISLNFSRKEHLHEDYVLQEALDGLRHGHSNLVTRKTLRRKLKKVERNYFKKSILGAFLFVGSLVMLFLGLRGLSDYWAFGVVGLIVFVISLELK